MSAPEWNVPARDDLLALRDLAISVATEVGEMVRTMRSESVEVALTKSSATDVVTRADLAAEELVIRRLAEHRPDDGILGEEGAARPTRTGITWVVDPIDGTVNYLYGRATYAVSLAAVLGDPQDVQHWQPLAGCVVAPALGVTYDAALGQGARRNGVRLATRQAPTLATALVGTGFSYDAQVRAWQGGIVATLLPQVRDIRRAGAGALDVCDTASGELDAHYEYGLNPWDLAAAELVATESGVRVRHTDLDARGKRTSVAAPPPLHAALAEAIGLPHLA